MAAAISLRPTVTSSMRNDFAGGLLCFVGRKLSASSEQISVGSLEHVWLRRAGIFVGLSSLHRAEPTAVGRVEQPVAGTAAIRLLAEHDGLCPALHDRLRLTGYDAFDPVEPTVAPHRDRVAVVPVSRIRELRFILLSIACRLRTTIWLIRTLPHQITHRITCSAISRAIRDV